MELKTVPLELKSLAEDGTFEGFANVYDVVDMVGDIAEKGAFAKTIQEKPRIPVKMEHADLIGTGTLEDTDAGPYLRGKLSLGVQKARDAYELMKDGALWALSIGWMPVKATKSGNIRRIKEARIFEVSLVSVPANELSLITDFKEGRKISRATKEQLAAAVATIQSLLGEEAGTDSTPEEKPVTTPAAEADKPAEELQPDPAVEKAESLIDFIRKETLYG